MKLSAWSSEDLKPQEITFDISTAEVEQPTPSVTEEQSVELQHEVVSTEVEITPSEDLKPQEITDTGEVRDYSL